MKNIIHTDEDSTDTQTQLHASTEMKKTEVTWINTVSVRRVWRKARKLKEDLDVQKGICFIGYGLRKKWRTQWNLAEDWEDGWWGEFSEKIQEGKRNWNIVWRM